MRFTCCTTHECPYPFAHLYTNTCGEGLCCTCLLTGGHCAEKVSSLVRNVLVKVLLARCPQFCAQGLTTFLHMGGTRRVVMPWRIVQKYAAYGADIVHFRCSWTGNVNK